PILVGRPSVVEARIKRFGLAIKAGQDFDLINPEDDPRYRSYVQSYLDVAGRRGVTPDAARTLVRTNATVIAALAVHRGEADAMLCGVDGRYMSHLRHIRNIVGAAPGGCSRVCSADIMSLVCMSLFCENRVNGGSSVI